MSQNKSDRRRKKREDVLALKNEFQVADPTPRDAVRKGFIERAITLQYFLHSKKVNLCE